MTKQPNAALYLTLGIIVLVLVPILFVVTVILAYARYMVASMIGVILCTVGLPFGIIWICKGAAIVKSRKNNKSQ